MTRRTGFAGLCRMMAAPAVMATALAAVQPACAQPFFGWGYGSAYAPPFGPDEVADILYHRYAVTRIIHIRPNGGAYDAQAIDRRGYRIHVTVDGRTGRVLESFVIGRRPYEDAVPLPPGRIPREPRVATLPRREVPVIPNDEDVRVQPRFGLSPESGLAPEGGLAPEDGLAPETTRPASRAPEKAKPAQPRQARTSDPGISTPPVPPRTPRRNETATRAPTPPREAAPAPDAPRPPVPARTVLPSVEPGGPKEPREPRGTMGPAEAPAPQPAVRAAAPTRQTLPEPLIDPKTGAANQAAAPVAPLDDAVRRPAAPSAPVPPVTFD